MKQYFIIYQNHWLQGLQPDELTFTCPKSTIETIEKGVKYVQS